MQQNGNQNQNQFYPSRNVQNQIPDIVRQQIQHAQAQHQFQVSFFLFINLELNRLANATSSTTRPATSVYSAAANGHVSFSRWNDGPASVYYGTREPNPLAEYAFSRKVIAH